MKKIILSFLFVTCCVTMNAQNIIDRATIKSSPNQVVEFSVEDVKLLKENFNQISESQAKFLFQLFEIKYSALSRDLTEQELIELTDSMKARTRAVLGDDLYLEISQNQELFYRMTGLAYLAKQ
ncbi:hypothetical protein [Flavobacterium sp. I3-2]|uniref:hypothetical protein n=1 Tax=Flavobacterium sp. I3-2 TaxID=2748319 RepID=UPI0015A9DE4B|nr:hypothetical protein [Flavobacterium sp. I3-2]